MHRLLIFFSLVVILAACSRPAPAPTRPTATSTISVPTATQELPVSTPLPQATATIAATDTPVVESTLTPTTESATPTSVPEAISFPDPNQFAWRPIAADLNRPVFLTHAGDGSNRIFIIEQAGSIRVVQNGQLQETPYLDIRDRVGSDSNEQGLLGLAFHPDFRENGHFYVNYTDKNGDTIIARFQASDPATNQVDPTTEYRLMTVAQPYPNHNGGMLAFGPDGYLYIGLGDGGSAGDPQNNAQSLQTLLGKILRVDVDGGEPFVAPPGNVFAADALPEIWAYGLRNPWRFSFDHQTGELYIGDVGQNQWEEVDFLPADSPAGANFGWSYMEGTHTYSEATPPENARLIPPITEYNHSQGCSVTGGVVYRGDRLPDWDGIYLFGDYCSGDVTGLLRDAQGNWMEETLFPNVGRIASFGEDENGEIYIIDHAGQILQLEGN